MGNIRASLPTFAKKWAWNLKYGLFAYPHFNAPDDTVRYVVRHLPETGSLLELGCGGVA